jgi:cytochrome P450
MDNFLSVDNPAQNLLSDFMEVISDSEDIEDSSSKVLEQLKTVFSIGQLTMTSILSWTFYFLSQHPDKLNILRHEINSLLEKDYIDDSILDNLFEYKYTQSVLSEIMRLFPCFFSLPRKPIDDIELGGFLFPKSHTVYVHLYGMHRNTKYWSEPDKFIPERFLAGSGYRVLPGSYLPFGAGSRACPYNQYIMKQMMLILIAVVKRYDFKDKTIRHVEPYPSWSLIPHPKIKLKFRFFNNH